MFPIWCSTLSPYWKQPGEQKHPRVQGVLGRGGCCLSVREEHWLHTWMAFGETLAQFHCEWLPMTTGALGRAAELTSHVMRRAGCPQDYETLMMRAAFLRTEPYNPGRCRTGYNLLCAGLALVCKTTVAEDVFSLKTGSSFNSAFVELLNKRMWRWED